MKPASDFRAKPVPGASKAVADLLDLRPGQSLELLKALHILTRDGKINQDSRRKLKQVYHLVQFIEPLLQAIWTEQGRLNLVDHGAGKSYLGFILYDLFFKALPLLGADERLDALHSPGAWCSVRRHWQYSWVSPACGFLISQWPRRCSPRCCQRKSMS